MIVMKSKYITCHALIEINDVILNRDNALWGLIMGKEMSRMKTVYVYAKLFGTRERCSMLDWVN